MKEPVWILDFGMLLPDVELVGGSSLAERIDSAFTAAWEGRASVDGFNALIVTAGMHWRDVLVLRAYARYMRQVGSPFSQTFIEEVVTSNQGIARLLVDLFRIRFEPTLDGDRSSLERELVSRIEAALDDVGSLDQDRILRTLLALIRSTLRTNFFQSDPDGRERSSVAFKLDPQQVPDMPLPKPRFEIWVFAPRVEGVHLRFGSVARGGLRWSDRQEDFRTEILGLVKAQEVKNAVIVPVGAKGGFYAKLLPDPSIDRDAWLAEGKAAYREFISSMLDITDNLVDGQVVPPVDVVRHDGDDAYLVVAADKGTATFSDLANEIAAEYDFWLGDAFASGGSVGYDHKAMGITARGAWESVQRHFRELDIDTQTEDFTVAGIGDMSGDVFGNGMLLSEHIRLVVAFDHRHVFVDPNPDARVSFAERRRLFDLPRSSWADYSTDLISPGGGVFARTLKSITITPEMSAALGLPSGIASLTPDELIQAALKAPVDLLWNGGIGTYVKAQTETNLDVGDKSNDRIRINGHDLRSRVVGEGGNLGLTQLGRIEAARHGVRLNTDAIDNSAGVDTSDHEVNIKILLDGVVREGSLSMAERNELLAGMTDDVARMVLEDNYGQNVVLGNARAGAPGLITVHQRMIRELERAGMLDRALEYLPDDEELHTRQQAGLGLTGPELCVLLAYAKIWLTKELNESTFATDEYFTRALIAYFPPILSERFAGAMAVHPLRSQIITTVTVNRLINIAGITFVFRAMEETGASAVEVVRAATAAMEIFHIPQFWQQVNDLDSSLSTGAQIALHLETRRLLDRATRWFLQTRGGMIDVQAEVDRFKSVVEDHTSAVPTNLLGKERERYDRLMRRFIEAGTPEDLARYAAASLDVFALLDIADICLRTGEPVDVVIPLYFTISDRYEIDSTLVKISDLPRGDRWSALARFALRSDLYSVVAGLTSRVLRSTSDDLPPLERLSAWEWEHSEGVSRARTTLDDIEAVDEPNLATLSVALRALRNLIAQVS
jgi:glutamate dehydrogenase